MVVVDVTRAIVAEAAEKGIDCILAHHPLIYNPMRAIGAADPVYAAIRNGISILAAHTNLDVADGKVAAYSLGESETTAYGVFVNSNGKTLLICGGEGTSYVYPNFFADGQELYFLDTFEGEIAICRAYANSSGASELFTGIVEPDGVYCKTLRDTFCIYDTTGRTDDAAAE